MHVALDNNGKFWAGLLFILLAVWNVGVAVFMPKLWRKLAWRWGRTRSGAPVSKWGGVAWGLTFALIGLGLVCSIPSAWTGYVWGGMLALLVAAGIYDTQTYYNHGVFPIPPSPAQMFGELPMAYKWYFGISAVFMLFDIVSGGRMDSSSRVGYAIYYAIEIMVAALLLYRKPGARGLTIFGTVVLLCLFVFMLSGACTTIALTQWVWAKIVVAVVQIGLLFAVPLKYRKW